MKEIKNLAEIIGNTRRRSFCLLLFLAVVGFMFFKLDKIVLISLLLFGFIISSYGIFSNLLKLSDLQKELKGLKNG